VSVEQNIEPLTHALSGITIISIPDKVRKYRTVRLNTGHLATLGVGLIYQRPTLPPLSLWKRIWTSHVLSSGYPMYYLSDL